MGLLAEEERRGLGVYLHVPFCVSRCPYCDFNTIRPASAPPVATDKPTDKLTPDIGNPTPEWTSLEQRYVRALLCELDVAAETPGLGKGAGVSPRVSTVYFGGGTPSVLTPGHIGELIKSVLSAFPPQPNPPDTTPEITIEANPETLTPEKLRGYMASGINRLSLGVQSFDSRVLKALGRPHTAARAEDAFTWARVAGFKNISIDLMYGAPGQGLPEWEQSLTKAVSLKPEHVSIYGLTIEESTPFGRARRDGKLEAAPEETEARMYGAASSILSEHGYNRYEISNFALPGRESRHNLNYWRRGEYLGLGAGAHSFIREGRQSAPSENAPPENVPKGAWGLRWWNVKDPYEYMDRVAGPDPTTIINGSETLTKEQAATEALMLGLRLAKGLDEEAFSRRFDMTPEEALTRKGLFEAGLICRRNGALRLTEKGVLLSNEVF